MGSRKNIRKRDSEKVQLRFYWNQTKERITWNDKKWWSESGVHRTMIVEGLRLLVMTGSGL